LSSSIPPCFIDNLQFFSIKPCNELIDFYNLDPQSPAMNEILNQVQNDVKREAARRAALLLFFYGKN